MRSFWSWGSNLMVGCLNRFNLVQREARNARSCIFFTKEKGKHVEGSLNENFCMLARIVCLISLMLV